MATYIIEDGHLGELNYKIVHNTGRRHYTLFINSSPVLKEVSLAECKSFIKGISFMIERGLKQ